MKIKVNNITINYIKEGNGKPLVLLHGNGEDHTIFLPLIECLKERFTIYALDSRNHGESSKTGDFSYETMAEDVYQFIKTLELEDVSLIGFSDGAIMAVLISLLHPNLFKKMALLGINLQPSDFKQENIDWIKSEYETTRDPLLKLMLEAPNIKLEDLKNIKTPSLIVRAEDELFNDSLYDDIVGVMPSAQLLVMKGHDHGSYIVGSDALYLNLKDFLNE